MTVTTCRVGALTNRTTALPPRDAFHLQTARFLGCAWQRPLLECTQAYPRASTMLNNCFHVLQQLDRVIDDVVARGAARQPHWTWLGFSAGEWGGSRVLYQSLDGTADTSVIALAVEQPDVGVEPRETVRRQAMHVVANVSTESTLPTRARIKLVNVRPEDKSAVPDFALRATQASWWIG